MPEQLRVRVQDSTWPARLEGCCWRAGTGLPAVRGPAVGISPVGKSRVGKSYRGRGHPRPSTVVGLTLGAVFWGAGTLCDRDGYRGGDVGAVGAGAVSGADDSARLRPSVPLV